MSAFLKASLRRFAFAVFAVAVLLCLIPMKPARAMGSKARNLNIVFILADDLGWADLGCYGNTFHETPNIDAMAAGGMLFTACYVQAACMPTRVGLLTGKNPSRVHNLYGKKQPCRTAPWDPLEPAEVTFAEALQARGYATGYVGKWGIRHWKDQGQKDQGFGSVYCHQPWYYLPDYHYPYGEHPLVDLEGKGDVGHLVDHMTGRAEEFISGNRDRPFLLFLSHFAVHTPIRNQGKPGLREKYRVKAERMREQRNADYAALVESLDDSTGRVLAKLRELGLDENTVVVFFSDNGGEDDPEHPGEPGITTNAPLRKGKASIYEGGVRVPMIVRWPGRVKPGTRCAVPVTLEDIYPTFLDIAGVPAPEEQKLDGFSLVPLLAGTGAPAREAVFLQWDGAMVRKGRFKLIEFPPYAPTQDDVENARKNAEKKGKKFTPPQPREFALELYDLEADPGETSNLAEERPEVAGELRRLLHAWMKEMHGEENYSLEAARDAAKRLGQEYPEP